MKHDHCTHPSTPKDRAVCRRAQGAQTGGLAEFVPAADKPALERARRKIAARQVDKRIDDALSKRHAGVTKRDKRAQEMLRRGDVQGAEREYIAQRRDEIEKLSAPQTRDKRDPDLIDNLARLKKRVSHREWDGQIHHAWNNGWEVRYFKMIACEKLVIDAPKGSVELVWDDTRRAYWFTPHHTSISRRVASLPVVMALGEGRG